MTAPPPDANRTRSAKVALVAGLSGLALAACATLPPAAPARIAKPAESYAASQSLAAPAADWPIDAWWTGYHDAQLSQLIDEALKGSPTLAATNARVRRAEALAAQARGAELPTVSAEASAKEMKQSYNIGIPAEFVPQGYNDYGKLALDFSWELDFWGKNRAAVAAATSEARAAEAEAAEARLMLASNIALAYAEFGRLYTDRDVVARAIDLQNETSQLVRNRVANGLDTRGTQRQAEAEPLASQAELAAIDEQILLTRHRLAALLGAGPDRGLAIPRPTEPPPVTLGLPASLAAELVGRRPDVTAARWRAEAAASRIREAKAAFYPNVNLVGFVGYQSLKLNEFFKSGSDVGSIGPALTLPVFEGGRLRAGLRGAEADRDAAVANYDAAVAEAFHQVADALASKRSVAAQIDTSRAALAASEDAYKVARLRYQGGLSPYSSVLLAEQGVLSRRRAVARLQGRAFAADVALVRALGGGYRAAP
ncbi:efflux transporter outer membrane subunit [Phenylobacterium soli]|uniref:Multidrug transporter n=1 Tax=Phenylobacterium soli TaxID=2170551 RepID=A0A328AKM3_9CAUL|nr:efflux transporter outer membrane subunit [Phenylobacterium soli]RAK54586.1 multidrug transporter [Phenylobacterium soli]